LRRDRHSKKWTRAGKTRAIWPHHSFMVAMNRKGNVPFQCRAYQLPRHCTKGKLRNDTATYEPSVTCRILHNSLLSAILDDQPGLCVRSAGFNGSGCGGRQTRHCADVRDPDHFTWWPGYLLNVLEGLGRAFNTLAEGKSAFYFRLPSVFQDAPVRT
jgi:hypothetical protein